MRTKPTLRRTARSSVGGPDAVDEHLRSRMRSGSPDAWLQWQPVSLSSEERWQAWQDALTQRKTGAGPKHVAGYVHFAYCQTSCQFCMYFHRVPRKAGSLSRHTQHIVGQVRQHRAVLGHTQLDNAYFGGGTPSLLPVHELAEVLGAYNDAFTVRGSFTLECNPLSLDVAKLRVAREHGVTRISMGIQSTDPDVLKAIGRINGPLEATGALINSARLLGFEVNVDLIVGLDEQRGKDMQAELMAVLALRPSTVTIYRYQPVARLPGSVDAGAAVRELCRPETRARALMAGYMVSKPNRFGARALELGALAGHAAAALKGTSEYHCFSDTPGHLLGIGPGAFSHIYGHSWHRDVTSLGAIQRGTAEPAYEGTRLSVRDERLTRLRGRLRGGGWVVDRAWPRAHDVALDEAQARGWIERRGPFVRLRDDDALDRMMPARDAAPSVLHRQGAAEPELTAGGSPSARGASELSAVLGLLGISAVGDRFAAATVATLTPSEVGLQLPGESVLRVRVETLSDDTDARCATANWALSHAPPETGTLSPDQIALFFSMVDAVREREPESA